MSKQDNLTDFLTDVADAIREKKGTTAKINPQNFSSEILSIEGGGGSEPVTTYEFNDVNFYDYEGTILYSYTWDEFVAKNEMPPLPTHHEGLTCQEWNYTLEEVLEQGGRCDVGAIYVPTDGNTHIKIVVASPCTASLGYNYSSNVSIDWGDGTVQPIDNMNSGQGIVNHNYEIGTYEINISGEITLRNVASCFLLPEILMTDILTGERCRLDAYSLNNAYLLKNITLSKQPHLLASAFKSTNIHHLNIPKEAKTLVQFSLDATHIDTLSMPPNFSGSNVLSNMNNLSRVHLPKSVMYTLTDSYRLISISASANHGTYTTISGNLYEGNKLVRGVNNNIADGTAVIGRQAYRRCLSIDRVNIPNSVTALEEGAFQWATSLSFPIIIPKGITSIPNYCFYNDTKIPYFDFRAHEVIPTLVNASAFQGMPNSCKIVVPDALYDQWIAATNWSTYASRIVKASEFVEPTTE